MTERRNMFELAAGHSRVPTDEDLANGNAHDAGLKEGTDGPRLNVVCLKDVEAEEVEWIWPGRIPRGKHVLASGDPGVGKSFWYADVASRITLGADWPDGSGRAPAGHVVFIAGEDGIADTIRPRVDAHGGDASRVHVIQSVNDINDRGEPVERTLRLDTDWPALDALFKALKPVGVFIDPLQAFLGNADSNNNADVRGVLAPLSMMAERHRFALVTIDHLTKAAAGKKALYRTLGSIGLVGNARVAWLFAFDPNDPDRRLMLEQKNNLHRHMPGLAYRIEDGRVQWDEEEVTMSADEASQATPGPKPEKLPEAIEWLRRRLGDGRWHESEAIRDEAEAEGIAFSTFRRAKTQLGVKSKKGTADESGKWFNRLPHKQVERLEHLRGFPHEDTQDAQDSLSRDGEHLDGFIPDF